VTANGVSTGNTAAANATALEALASTVSTIGGGTLYFPGSTSDYPLNGVDLAGMSNLKFLGEYGGSVLDNSGQVTAIFSLAGATNITFEGLTFKGDFDTNTDAVGTSVAQRGIITDNNPAAGATRGVTVRHCIADNLSGELIRIGPNTSEVVVENCTLLAGLAFTECRGIVQSGDSRPVSNVTIKNNIIYGTTTAPNSYRPDGINGSDDLIDSSGWVRGLHITGNQIDGKGTSGNLTMGGDAIGIYVDSSHATETTQQHDIVISGNTFYRNLNGNATKRAGAIILRDNASVLAPGVFNNVSITDNTFDECRYALYAEFVDGNLKFSSNEINDTFGPVELRAGRGWDIEGNRITGAYGNKALYIWGDENIVRNNTIRESNFASPDFWGSDLPSEIYVTQGDGTEVSGNTMDGAAHSMTVGIRVAAGSDHIIDTNIVKNYTTYGISLRNTNVIDATVRKNVLIGNALDLNDAGVNTDFENGKFTSLGGFAVPVVNGTGSASVKGSIVTAMAANNNKFDLTAAGSDKSFGVVLEDGIADGLPVYIVVSGIAEVLVEDAANMNRTNWCIISATTAGRVKNASSKPTTGSCGIIMQTVGGGTDNLAPVMLSFD
jgi:hypothetical protein